LPAAVASRGDSSAQFAHHRADARAVGAVDLGALKRLRARFKLTSSSSLLW